MSSVLTRSRLAVPPTPAVPDVHGGQVPVAVGEPLIRLRGVTKTYGTRQCGVSGAARRRPRHRGRRVRRRDGAQRLGQVHRDEHPRLPRHAHQRRLPVSRRRTCSACRATSARCCAGATSASCSRASTCWRAPRRSRTSSCRCSIAACRARERHAAAAKALDVGGPRRLGDAHAGRACRAASSSAWRSRARSSPSRRCCWPTSPPATSTASAAREIMELLRELNERQRHHHR